MAEDTKELNEFQIVEADPIKEETAQLINAIVKAQTPEELEQLYKKFDIVNTKKNAVRLNTLSEMLDKVNQEASDRLDKRRGEMCNKEVIDYMNAIQNQIERAQRVIDGIKDIKAVQINNETKNNTVNINIGSQDLSNLDRESRDKVTDFIAEVLSLGDKKDDIIVETVNAADVVDVQEAPQEQEQVVQAVLDSILNDDEYTGDD